MATFFGRPVGNLYKDVSKAAGIGAALGFMVGYHDARKEGDAHPFIAAAQTAGEWALTDTIVEAGLGILAPGVREGSVVRSAIVSSAIGGVTGAVEGYATAKLHGDDDPYHSAIITAGQWAAIDGGIELTTRGILPALRNISQ
jgi:hypothetical protein